MLLSRVVALVVVASGAVLAQPKGTPPPSGGGSWVSMFAMMGIILLIMYFLMIRPEHARQKERRALLASLKKGQRVMTGGGIYGTVVGVKESTVMLRVDEGVTIEFDRSAVASVLSGDAEADKEKTEGKGGKKS